MIKVHPHKHNNDDDLVVNAARASFAKTADQYSVEQNEKLINYLARELHINPFFHNRFTFRMDVFTIPVYDLHPNQLSGMVWHKMGYTLHVRHSFYGWLNLLPHLRKEDQAKVLSTLQCYMPSSMKAFGKDADSCDFSVQFEHPDFTDVSLFVELPIFTARQEYTHKVGFTRSERSGRYVSDEPELFTPNEWREKPANGIKQGSGGRHSLDDDVRKLACDSMYNSVQAYNKLIEMNTAPEQARMLLPQAMITRYMVTGSLSAYARMIKERTAANGAQKEIRDYAGIVNSVLKQEYGSNWGK